MDTYMDTYTDAYSDTQFPVDLLWRYDKLEGESDLDYCVRVLGLEEEVEQTQTNPRQQTRRREYPRLHRRRYIKANPLPSNVLDWFEHQFGKSSFDGWFHLGYRREGTAEIWPLFKGSREKVLEFLQNFNVNGKMDFYITANATKTGSERKNENLFSIHNIVIDIDNHDINQENTSFVHRLLVSNIEKDLDAPPPTAVVYTGRGVQLWWAIKPVAKACVGWVKEIRETLVSAIEEIISEYPDLEGYTVDRAASCNNVGYYRLPGTVNTHTGREVSLEWSSTRFDTHELIQWAKQWQEERKPIEPPPKLADFSGRYTDEEIGVFQGLKTSAFYRIRQLVQLRILRDRDVGAETRNNFNFIFYNTLLPVLGPDEAWDRLLAFNAGFKVPMTDTELHRTVDTATKKGGYRYRNETLICFLSVTQEEQAQIGLYPVDSPNHALLKEGGHRSSARELARTLRDDRNARIKNLAADGKTKTEICVILGLNPRTVQGVLGKGSQKEADIKTLHDAGLSVQEVADKLMIPARTVRWHFQKLKN